MTVRSRTFPLACLALLVPTLPLGPAQAQIQLVDGRPPGEFSVGPTGQAAYRIPLEVPPGTAGLAPDLALVYSGGGGNGIMGAGWSLSGVPMITRCPATVVVDGYASSVQGTMDDAFCIDGERLVQVNGDYFVDSEYRTLRETWTRVTSHHGGSWLGPEWFEAETRDGRRIEFGRVPEARVITDDVRFEPTRPLSGRVNLSFGVNRITDRHGNVMDVTWEQDERTLYPKTIRYGGRRVEFIYEDRPDSPIRYVAWLPTRRDRRLVRIDVYLDPAGPGSPATPERVRQYRLTYLSSQSMSTGASLLRTVQACDGNATSCLPQVLLTYDSPTFNGAFNINYPAGAIFQDDLRYDEGAMVTPGDFNGDGFTDFIRQARGGWANDATNMANTYIGDGQGGFNQHWLVDNVILSGNNRRLFVGDYTGDGIDDFIVQELCCRGDTGALPLQLYRATGTGGFQRTALLLNVDVAANAVRIVPGDFDGDRRMDFIRQEIGDWGAVDGFASTYFSEGTSFRREFFDGVDLLDGRAVNLIPGDYNGDGRTDLIVQERSSSYASSMRDPAETWLSVDDGEFIRIPFTNIDPKYLRANGCNIIPGDYNGDGLTDFIRQERGDWDDDFVNTFQVFFARGDGRFDIVTPGSPARYDRYQDYGRYDDSATFTPGDFNGDGLTDLLRREFGKREEDDSLTFQIYLSKGDGTFAVFTPSDATYQRYLRTDLGANVITGDFDGDGQADFVRQERNQLDNDTVNTFGVFRNPHQRPDFLVQIDEGHGLRTQITYEPITNPDVYTRGAHATRSPMYVVASYVQHDRYRDQTSREFSYTYEDARFGANGRGFLHFRKVSRIEQHTGLRTDAFYDLAWPFNTHVSRTEVRRVADDSLVRTTDLDYVVSRPAGANYALALARSEETHYEGSGSYQTRKEYTYDDYGNATLVVDQGVVGDPGDDTATCNVYSNDATSWRLGLALETTEARSCSATCGCADVLQRERRLHDVLGRVVLTERYESEADRWIGESLAYDEFGNVVEQTNAAGAITQYVFDSAYHTYPVERVLDADGEAITSRYEYSFSTGAIVREVKPDGSVFRRQIDAFGRTKRLYGPGPSGAEALLVETWFNGTSSSFYEEVKIRADFDDTRFITTRTYRDAFGQPYLVEKRDSTGGASILVTRTYDDAGRVIRESLPHYAGENALFTQYEYDERGRSTRATLPNGATQESEYSIATGACPGCIVRRTVTENRGAPEERRIIHDIDGRGKVRRREHEGGMVLRYELDLAGRVTRYEDASVATSITYDSLGRLETVDSPDTGLTRYEYDDAGRIREIRDALDHTVTFEHDALNRLTAQRFSDDREIHFEYGAQTVDADLVSSAYVEQDGEERSRFDYTYDAYGNLTSKAITYEGQTYTFSMTYGPGGQPTSLTYPDGSTLEHSYDGLNRLREIRMGGVAYATYDDHTALGAPGSVHYANGVDTTYQYASHGVVERNVIESSTAGTLLDQEFEHDLRMFVTRIVDHRAGQEQELFYDARGFLEEVRSPGSFGTRTYGYDAAGNLTSRDGVTQQYQGHRIVSDSNGATYGYDAAGNRTSMHREGADWSYGYDHARQLTEVFRGGQLVGANEYDPEGMRIRKTDESGVVTTYLTPQYEVTRFPNGSSLHTRYVFDHTGRVASVTVDGAVAEQLIAQREAALGSNGAGADGGVTTASAGSFGTSLPSPAGVAAMIGLFAFGLFGFALFAVARVPSAPRTDFMRWNPRLVPVVPVVLTTFLVSVAPGCQWGADGGEAAAGTGVVNGLPYGDVSKVLDPGGNGYGYPIAGTFFFHQDRVGSTSLVTDAAGDAVSRVVYLPYGEVYQPASEGYDVFRQKFGDKELDRDAGLYYFDARYYDPVAGRFLTADSYLVGGEPELPGVLNRYQYAGNNPIVHADPSGHLVIALFIGAVLLSAALGGYMGGVSASGGNWNLTQWDWKDPSVLGSVLAGAAFGALAPLVAVAGVAGVAAALVLAAAESIALSQIQGASWEETGRNLAWDLPMALFTHGIGEAGRAARAGRGGRAAGNGRHPDAVPEPTPGRGEPIPGGVREDIDLATPLLGDTNSVVRLSGFSVRSPSNASLPRSASRTATSADNESRGILSLGQVAEHPEVAAASMPIGFFGKAYAVLLDNYERDSRH